MALSDLTEPAELLYRIQFAAGVTDTVSLPPPTVNPLGLTWTVGASPLGVLNASSHPSKGPLTDPSTNLLQDHSILKPDGLHVQITRPMWTASGPDVRGTTDVVCVVSPLPASLGRFRISADFELDPSLDDPFDPHKPMEQWAATVIARDGADRTVTGNATIVGATHQVRGGSPPAITLGAGSGWLTVSPPMPRAVAVPGSKAHDSRHAFTLGAYFDCYSGNGQSQLSTSGGYYWENAWTHPFRLPLSPEPATNPITGIGFALAIAKGFGTAHIIVKEFRVLHWPLVHTAPDDPVVDG